MKIDRETLIRRFVSMQYQRNDVDFSRGTFRVRGDTIEIIPVYEELAIRIEMFGDEIEAIYALHPLTGDVVQDPRCRLGLPGNALRREPADHPARHRHDPGRARRAPAGARAPGQAARGPAPAHAHDLRHRDDGADRVLQRHRELLAAHRRPAAGRGAALPARLLPRGLPRRHRRVARHRAADRRDVRGRCLAQAHPRRARLPAAERAGQPPAQVGRSSSSASARRSTSRRPPASTSSASPTRIVEQIIRPTGLVDPQIVVKPTQGPDRRPARADPACGSRRTSASSSRP